jgi:hypothetical protein
MYPLAVFAFGRLNHHIPLTRDRSGYFNIDVSSPSFSTTVPMRVSLGPYDITLPRNLWRLQRTQDRVTFAFHSGNVSLTTPPLNPVLIVSSFACVSIAPNRSFVQFSDAVAIVRNTETTQLVVRSTMDAFVAACQRDSIIQLPIPVLHVFDGFFHIQGNDVDRIFPLVEIALMVPSMDVLKVPIGLETEVTASIISTGAILRDSSLSQHVHFSNCTSRIIPSLPIIRLSLLNGLDEEFNTIVYYPEDYIRFRSGERCKLLIVAATASSFAPFAIPDTNVRISSDSMMSICDANKTQ